MRFRHYDRPQRDMRKIGLRLLEGKGPIVELGCHTGNAAVFVARMGLSDRYIGIDWNPIYIEKAKRRFPNMEFICMDVMSVSAADILKGAETVIAFQVLEHIGAPNGNQDKMLLKRLRRGTEVLVSVPNFDSIEHKRYYEGLEWLQRYGNILNIETVYSFGSNRYPKRRCFLIHGFRA